MNYKILSLEMFAILVAYLIVTMPIAFATDVSVIFPNGTVGTIVDISAENIVNRQVQVIHDPFDITWSNVRIGVAISSATPGMSISRIYLYKCKTRNPMDCVTGEPMEFDTYIDTELAWADISERTGSGLYPQAANILTMVRLESEAGISWESFWNRVERTTYNTFTVYDDEVSEVDFYAKSADLVGPVETFINNYQMLPFNWAQKVVFSVSRLFTMGADDDELEAEPVFQRAFVTSNEINTINKDFYFVMANTSILGTDGITLNLNPSATCGDNNCEADLGETSENCCYDCGCATDYYCDLENKDSTEGECKLTDDIELEIVPGSIPNPKITNCNIAYEDNITVQINNAPSTLPDSLSGSLTLEDTRTSMTCDKTGAQLYSCPVVIQPSIRCGADPTFTLGPNHINMTLVYNDGPGSVALDLGTPSFPIVIDYDCGCPEGYYCSYDTQSCETEASMSITVLRVETPIREYDETAEEVEIDVKVNNVPSDYTVTGVNFYFGNLSYDSSSEPIGSGSANCNPWTGNIYNCTMPLHIDNYDEATQYRIWSNHINFTVQFSSGSQIVTKTLSSAFSDILIPSKYCGNGVCDAKESHETCCLDCPCPGAPGTYCDPVRQCQSVNDIELIVKDPANPDYLEDCDVQHQVNMTLEIESSPSDAQLQSIFLMNKSEILGWEVTCGEINPVTGRLECSMMVPEIACYPSENVIGPDQIDIIISFSNGTQQITKDLSALIPEPFSIFPTFECGDGICEVEYGENPIECCIDCPCNDLSLYEGIDVPEGDIVEHFNDAYRGTFPDFDFSKDVEDFFCNYDDDDEDDVGQCVYNKAMTLVIDNYPNLGAMIYPEPQTCEIDTEINVRTHIENAPYGLKVEGYGALIDGRDPLAEPNCKRMDISDLYGEETGTSEYYNCTITIPYIWNCTREYQYTYTNNSIYFYVSYNDGNERASNILRADLPNIHIAQKGETLYDIRERHMDKIEDEIDDIERTAKKWIVKAKDCLQQAEWLLLTLIIVGVIGGATMGALDAKESGKNAFGGGFKGAFGGIQLGSDLIKVYLEYCTLLMEIGNFLIEMETMEIQFLNIEYCLDVVDHEMRNDRYRGRESEAIKAIEECINMLNDVSDTASDAADNFGDAVDDFGDSGDKLIDDIEDQWPGDDGFGSGTGSNFQVLCDNRVSDQCCNYKTTRIGSSGTPRNLKVKLLDQEGKCDDYPIVSFQINQGREQPVVYNKNTGATLPLTRCNLWGDTNDFCDSVDCLITQSTVPKTGRTTTNKCDNEEIAVAFDEAVDDEITVTVSVYCFKCHNDCWHDFSENWGDIKEREKYLVGEPYTQVILVDKQPIDNCRDYSSDYDIPTVWTNCISNMNANKAYTITATASDDTGIERAKFKVDYNNDGFYDDEMEISVPQGYYGGGGYRRQIQLSTTYTPHFASEDDTFKYFIEACDFTGQCNVETQRNPCTSKCTGCSMFTPSGEQQGGECDSSGDEYPYCNDEKTLVECIGNTVKETNCENLGKICGQEGNTFNCITAPDPDLVIDKFCIREIGDYEEILGECCKTPDGYSGKGNGWVEDNTLEVEDMKKAEIYYEVKSKYADAIPSGVNKINVVLSHNEEIGRSTIQLYKGENKAKIEYGTIKENEEKISDEYWFNPSSVYKNYYMKIDDGQVVYEGDWEDNNVMGPIVVKEK